MIGFYCGSEINSKGYLYPDFYLCHEGYVNAIPETGGYPDREMIDKINANQDGYFDFSKAMIDIGSEIGQFSLNTNFGYYYMFDGNRKKCIMADANMLVRGKSDICEVHNTLLSDKFENINYDGFNTEYSELPANLCEENMPDREKFHYQTAKTLDSYNILNVGFIKIDVEGMEEKVLRGGVGTLVRNNYPPILFELWDVGYWYMTKERHDSLQNFLEGLGYEILWHWGDFETHLAIHK